MAAVGRQEVEASLLVLEVTEVGCCLKAEEGARRSSTEAHQRSPLVGEGEEEIHASLVEHWAALGNWRDWALVLRGATAERAPHETGGSGVAWGCWVLEEAVHLKCPVWMRN